MGVKAVLFDFWGTLVNAGTWSPVRQSQQILRVNLPFGDFVHTFETAFMTTSFKDQQEAFTAVCQAFDVRPHPMVIEKLIGVWNKNRILANVFPETEQVLAALKKEGYKLGLLCNTECFGIEILLQKFNLPQYFDAVQLSFQNGLLKSDPVSFKTLLKSLKVKPTEAVMVGDSVESDMAGAENAGLRAILVDRKSKLEYAHKIPDLTNLPEMLKKIE